VASPKLTPAQRRALEVLGEVDAPVRSSRDNCRVTPTVCGQSMRPLRRWRLVRIAHRDDYYLPWYEITPAGREVLRG
jgi:hypothetical protein